MLMDVSGCSERHRAMFSVIAGVSYKSLGRLARIAACALFPPAEKTQKKKKKHRFLSVMGETDPCFVLV